MKLIFLGVPAVIRLLACLAVLAGVAACGEDSAGSAGAKQEIEPADIVDMAVRFEVAGLNRSAAPLCPGDGRRYVVAGHIVGPRSAMIDGAAGTVYVHGVSVPEQTWRMPLPGYDYGLEQARRGHVSITFDRLGYGATSPLPDGLNACLGVQADIVHQVIQQLRSASYQSDGAVLRFSRLAVAGHSLGQDIAQIVAYSFDGVDALVVGGFSDPAVLSVPLVSASRVYGQNCAFGGAPKVSGAPGHYARTFEGKPDDFLFHDAEPQVIEAFTAATEADPCDLANILAFGPVNALLLSGIRVPVLLFYGDHDSLWPAGVGRRQKALFIGSPDVTLLELGETGHMSMLGRSAPELRVRVSDWLKLHGF